MLIITKIANRKDDSKTLTIEKGTSGWASQLVFCRVSNEVAKTLKVGDDITEPIAEHGLVETINEWLDDDGKPQKSTWLALP